MQKTPKGKTIIICNYLSQLPNLLNLDILYGSRSYEDALTFYNSFDAPSELIKWMRERETLKVEIVKENNFSSDIVIVVPTRDYGSKLAMYCRNTLFKGFNIIFVLGNGKHFNFSHSVNEGIREALKYEPKWIIVSNDDMEMIDPPNKLRNELSKYSPEDFRVLHAQGPGFHSKPLKLGPRSMAASLLYLSENNKRLLKIEESLRERMGEILIVDNYTLKHRFFTKKLVSFRNPGSFFILSSKFLETIKGDFFDKTFINGAEDLDFSLRYLRKGTIDIDYSIGEIGGQSLGGMESMRFVWDIANRVYLTHLYNTGTYSLQTV